MTPNQQALLTYKKQITPSLLELHKFKTTLHRLPSLLSLPKYPYLLDMCCL
jgi:hypothetical protein